MNEKQAKKQLRNMLTNLTPGSVIHLLSEVFHDEAETAARLEDSLAYERCKSVECTLFVVGLGVDATCPR
jgi:hypothetical protein